MTSSIIRRSVVLITLAVLAMGFISSLYTAYRITRASYAPEKLWGTFAPYAVLMVVLGILNVWLFVLPMAMRM